MPSFPSAGSTTTGLLGGLYHDPAPVGGVAVAVLLGTYGLFGVPVDVPVLVAGFCGVTAVYAVDRGWGTSAEDRINRPARVVWVRAHRGWLVAEGVVLVGAGGVALTCLEGRTLWWTAALGGVAGLHLGARSAAGPLLWGFAKPIVVAAAWAVGGALLPLVEAGHPIGQEALAFVAYRGLFILPNLLLADWADRQGDAEAGLAPWADRWTLRQVRWTATGGLLLAGLGAAGGIVGGPAPVLLAIDAGGLLLMLGAVWGLEPSRPRNAFLTDLVVAWPLVPAVVAWMML